MSGGSGTLAAGQTTTNITIVINGDPSSEPPETFSVVLSNSSGNATLGAATGSCTIINNNGPPGLSISGTTVTKPYSGTTNAMFTVFLNVAATNTVTFQYATQDGTALAGNNDYVPVSNGAGTIAAGQTTTNIAIVVNGNPWINSNLTFAVAVSNPTNAVLIAATGVCTIVNNNYPFVWTGAAGDGLASTTSNWQWNGSAATRVPGTADVVTLNGTSSSNMTWNAGANGLPAGVFQWTQSTGYTGMVTFPTVYGAAGFTNFQIVGNCVLNGGTWTHTSNTTAQTYRLCAAVGGNFTLASGASVTATGRGYSNANAPAGSGGLYNPLCGASHGGQGGRMVNSVGITYGEAANPVTIGAGGLTGGSNDGAGGGAVYLTVAGVVSISGTIDANAYAASGPAAGAGGSVCLRAGSLSGSGTIRANGNQMGGGGRVAVILTNSTSFGSIGLQAYGGNGGANANWGGAAGTVYKEVQGQSPGTGTLIIDNNNQRPPFFGAPYFNYASTLMPAASAWNAAVNLNGFSQVVVTNGAILGINADTALTWTNAPLQFAGPTNSYVSIAGTNNLTLPATMVVSNYTLLVDMGLTASGTWIVRTNGAIACSVVDSRTQPPLNLTVNGDLTLDRGP